MINDINEIIIEIRKYRKRMIIFEINEIKNEDYDIWIDELNNKDCNN